MTTTAPITVLDRAKSYLDAAIVYAYQDADDERHTLLVHGRTRLESYDRTVFAQLLTDAGFTDQRVIVALRSVEHPDLPALRQQAAQALRLIGATRLSDRIADRERCDDVKQAAQLVAHQIAKGHGSDEHEAAMAILYKVADALGYRESLDRAVTRVQERAVRSIR